MEFIADMLGHGLGSVNHGDFADTWRDAHGAFAGQVVHGVGGGPDLIQNATGHTTAFAQHQIGGGTMYTDAAGHTIGTVQSGHYGGPDVIHDAAGGLAGMVQHGGVPGAPSTLYGANWQPLAQSFGVHGLEGF